MSIIPGPSSRSSAILAGFSFSFGLGLLFGLSIGKLLRHGGMPRVRSMIIARSATEANLYGRNWVAALVHNRLDSHTPQTSLLQEILQRHNCCANEVKKGARLDLNKLSVPPACLGTPRDFIIISQEDAAQSFGDNTVG